MSVSRRAFVPSITGIAVAVLASTAAPGCSGGDKVAPPTPTGTSAESLYAEKTFKWTNGSVDVCFEPSNDPNVGMFEDIVRTWATNSWGQAANINFHGWGSCTGGENASPSDGIRIQFQDTVPVVIGGFGKQIAGIPGGMTLNYTLVAFRPPGTNGFSNAAVLGWEAVHEFGHALGFRHEQDRPDATSSASPTGWVGYYGESEWTCIQNYLDGLAPPGLPPWYDQASSAGGILSPIGFYDHISVMNYCNTENRITNHGILSPGDVMGAQAVYGPRAGTEPINEAANPVSQQFPLSTVNLQTPGNADPSCTGVILSTNATTTRILTAAHCKVGRTTTVQFYPATSPGDAGSSVATGASPTGTTLPASTTTPVEVQYPVKCDPDTENSIPSTCYANDPLTGDMYYADLAVLTVDAPVPSGYVAVALGASDSLTAPPSDSTWEVGTGWGGPMQWAPTDELGAAVGGFFTAAAPFSPGGPVYEYVPAPLVSANGLVLLGIGSTLAMCADQPSCKLTANVYTSVVDPRNYTWLTNLGGAPAKNATPAQAVLTFGASR